MSNPYIEYYKNQAGSGLTAFEGYQYQRGHGWFGALKGLFKPLLGWFGKKALKTGVAVGADYLAGQKFTDALSGNLKKTGGEMLDEGAERGKKFLQTGSGKRRRRRKKKSVIRGKTIKEKSSRKKRPVRRRKQKKKRTRKSSKKRSRKNSKSKNKFVNFSKLFKK